MLERVEEGTVYKSRSDIPFLVLYIGKHGQDCSLPMVVYTNLTDTSDTTKKTIWAMEESLFMKLFSESDEQIDDGQDHVELARAILHASYTTKPYYLRGTINWAFSMARKVKSFLG